MAQIGWTYPSNPWMKLNVYECSKGNSGVDKVCGLIQDNYGTLIKGFAINTSTAF